VLSHRMVQGSCPIPCSSRAGTSWLGEGTRTSYAASGRVVTGRQRQESQWPADRDRMPTSWLSQISDADVSGSRRLASCLSQLSTPPVTRFGASHVVLVGLCGSARPSRLPTLIAPRNIKHLCAVTVCHARRLVQAATLPAFYGLSLCWLGYVWHPLRPAPLRPFTWARLNFASTYKAYCTVQS
jgi:hypothetical protein